MFTKLILFSVVFVTYSCYSHRFFYYVMLSTIVPIVELLCHLCSYDFRLILWVSLVFYSVLYLYFCWCCSFILDLILFCTFWILVCCYLYFQNFMLWSLISFGKYHVIYRLISISRNDIREIPRLVYYEWNDLPSSDQSCSVKLSLFHH